MYDFKKIGLSDKELFESYFGGKFENSEANFTNLYIWKDYYDTRYVVDDGFLIIMNTSPKGQHHCYMPYGKGDLSKCLKNLYEYCNFLGQPLRITNATEEQADFVHKVFPNAQTKENYAFNDYVYEAHSLSSLEGKKLHSKRNHLNRFKSTYEGYVYRPLEKSDFKNCLKLASRLMLKDREENDFSYVTELKSINTAFKNFDFFGLKGGVIEIDGQIVAFTVGEAHTENCALIHIEKADTQYDGIYVAINNEFVKNTWMDFTYINREEDMGIEGLRKAKRSYKPHHMIRKFMCIIE